MIDGEALAAFVAVAQERSFSRAADRLGVVQSVVSKRVRRLEDQLAVALLDRRVRTNIHLTRIGALFLPEALDTVARLEQAERSARNLRRGTEGPLRIGFVFSAALNGTLTHLLATLRSNFPDLLLLPRLLETPEQLAALENGELDIGLLRSRPSYPRRCDARSIQSEALVIALSCTHDLASMPVLNPTDLAGETFILPQFHEQVGLIDSVRALSRAGMFPMPGIIRTEDFVTAACLAAGGAGVVLAPASLSNLRLGGVCFRDLAGFDEHLELVFVYHAEAPDEPIKVALDSFSEFQV